MKPLSARTRRTYFFVLLTIFVAAILPLALYAAGWRVNAADGFVRTGGIYLHLSSMGVTAYINGEPVETNSLLQRNIFVQNLAPAEYEFSVAKEGFHPWKKALTVRSQRVTEAHPLLVPRMPERIAIPEMLELVGTTAGSTTSATIANPAYAQAALLFTPPVSPKKASSTEPNSNPREKTKGKLVLTPEGATVTVVWQGSAESAPFYFCTTGACVATTTVSFADTVHYADFYPDEEHFILMTLPGGVYAAELDARSGATVVPLAEVPGADFRIDASGAVIIKEGETLYTLVL